jgi:ParB family transcriptional regulator, chromosome partitioning protein
MTSNVEKPETARIHGIQERRLGGTLLRTYRSKVDLDEVVPNERQPRLGPKDDEELQRQIEANEGIFEPLLVEPHPELPGKFRIIDGERRWTNSKLLVEQGREQYRKIPVEVIDRTLTEEERLRTWIYIHRQRKEWDTREKEMVAYRLVELTGRASTANILGISMRELDRLIEVFELSERIKGVRGSGAAVTWARELAGLSKKLLTPTVTDAILKKVNEQRITNSKDLRKLRTVLRDPVASAHFLKDEGDIESALLRISAPHEPKQKGLLADLTALCQSLEGYSWTELETMRGNALACTKILEATKLLERLNHTLARNPGSDKSSAVET